ncbi:MAG: CehA/McbA family metallohydrolase [Verrucomicrobiota bacterium]
MNRATFPLPRFARFCLFISAGLALAAAKEPGTALPPGAVDFAARLAHNHWYLWGPAQRAELESLNRILRAALPLPAESTDVAPPRSAGEQAAAAAIRLHQLVLTNANLIRIDLTGAQPSLALTHPVELPGDTGALLFEVLSPGEGLRYATAWGDLSQPPGESSLVAVDIGEGGATYALAGLEHIPFGRTTLLLEFRRAGMVAWRTPLEVHVPSPGRLKLTVISDDTGSPTPAMVRLMWRTDGLQRPPANGIEFASQFDKQGTPSGARAANLPGPLAAHFWCVPEPFDMALAPGVWQIGVRRGVEHEVVFEDVTIRSGEVVEKTIRPRRWADMRASGWWSGDDHVHGRLLSDEDGRRLMAWIQAEDIHLANVVKMGDIYRTYFEQRGFGPDYRVLEGDYALVPGQECPRTHDQLGHTLAMNITSMVRDTDRYFLYDEVFDAVHAQGGLAGYAHVNAGLFHVERDMSLNVPRQKVDFAEILQFNQLGTDLYYDFLNLGCKLTASAGSDVPWGGTVGEVRAYAYLEDEPFSADAWFHAFGRGRTFTTSGPMIEFRVDDALPGDEIRLSENRDVRIQAKAWGDPKRMGQVKLEIIRQGEVLRSAESSTGSSEVNLETTAPGGFGCWIAARARATDGTTAHTSPVYLVREGFRFWKFEMLDQLIAKRLASLAQIEQIATEARQRTASNASDTDRYRQQLALQGGALLERVKSLRGLYEEFGRIRDQESATRRREP